MKLLFGVRYTTILIVLFLTCNRGQNQGNIKQEINCIDLEPGQEGFIQLAQSDEPGEPLLIYGKVIDGTTNQPIKGASLFLYQTDSSGIYNASGGPDDQARIQGTIHTNENGCFKIKTILPGDYPRQRNSRHLHYVINAKGYEELKSILFFKGFTTTNITGQGPLLILDIKKGKNDTWIGAIDITMEPITGSTP